MTQESNKVSSIERWTSLLALLGAVMLFFGVPLRHPLMLFDVTAPLMAWQLWRRRRELRMRLSSWQSPLLWTALAVAWAVLASAVQMFRGAAPLYNTAIAVYMLLACAFYCVTPLPPPRMCLATAAGMLGCCLAVFLLGGRCGGEAAARLFYTEQNLLGTAGSVLARRFQFFFTNPNLLGSAYVLPYLLAIPWAKRRLESPGCSWRTWLLLAAATLLGTMPLLHSVSKHLLLTFGLCCGLLASFPPLKRVGSRYLAPAVTILLGLLFALTVWFRTYPAVRQWPWVDTGARSNYSTHQEVYLDIICGTRSAGALLFGHGADELRKLYPQYADSRKIASILEAYYGHKLDGTFGNFMDPHNEYLNTASLFGIPAILMLAVSAAMLFRLSWKRCFIPGTCAVAALLCACLWDDLSSKRWLWLYAGMLMQYAETLPQTAGAADTAPSHK